MLRRSKKVWDEGWGKMLDFRSYWNADGVVQHKKIRPHPFLRRRRETTKVLELEWNEFTFHMMKRVFFQLELNNNSFFTYRNSLRDDKSLTFFRSRFRVFHDLTIKIHIFYETYWRTIEPQ